MSGAKQVWIKIWQGPTVPAAAAGCVCLDLAYIYAFPFFIPLFERRLNWLFVCFGCNGFYDSSSVYADVTFVKRQYANYFTCSMCLMDMVGVYRQHNHL